MEKEHGEEKTKALIKYEGVTSLTKSEATEIINLVYPTAPKPEQARAVALCASYGLNPLMGHVFLIPFKDKWATVMGINAKRLMASRLGSYSYVDGTPRVMTKDEQVATFGEENDTHITAVTKLKDMKTGAEAVGYGTWPKATQPYGTDKGNSGFNMAAIRSESQALNRLRPGEMPMGVDVMPEEAIEGDYTEVTETPDEIELARIADEGAKVEDEVAEEVIAEMESKPIPEPEKGKPEHIEEGIQFDHVWLTDSLKEVKWSEATAKSYLKNVFGVETEGTIVDVVQRLTKEQVQLYFAEIQKALDKVQARLL